MKLIYTVTAEDRRQGQLIYDSALAPMRWWTAIAEPFTFVALGLGVYYYTTGSWILAISLFASFAYLFSKGFLLRSIGNLLTGIWTGLGAMAAIAAWIPARRAARMKIVDALGHV